MTNLDTGYVSSYDKLPTVRISSNGRIFRDQAIFEQLRTAAVGDRPVIAIDTYPGADLDALTAQLERGLADFEIINMESAAHPSAQLTRWMQDNLTDDRVFGVLSHATIHSLYDAAELATLRARVQARPRGVVLIGWGATLVAPDASVVVLAELSRWEIQLRYRKGMPNWHAENEAEDPLRKIKRGYFVEWRIADRHKRPLMDSAHFVLDLNLPNDPAMITGEAFRDTLTAVTTGPFRVVPYFDPGVWGGQWMKRVCGLPEEAPNYAWSFDGVPEENSLLITDGESTIQIPSVDVVFAHPRELLGEKTFARFGAEFPIRFDFLDTMSGGNLSLQVHPLTDYIRDRFGMAYTQDESYYMLDATENAVVYLGLKDGIDSERMASELAAAQAGENPFPADTYTNVFPAKKHDHFSIPAGTVHCSGENSMVLEISATPYLFTFKMWDWGRVGMDGVPRPVHLDHALANIQWNRDTAWVKENLIDQVRDVAEGDGWREERTGLHELEFIEVRRHWFTGVTPHDTQGTVNVLNLVEGAEAIVESATGAFEPFVVHYAETFIVPAAVGAYTIRPFGPGEGQQLATVKAFVRGTHRDDATVSVARRS